MKRRAWAALAAVLTLGLTLAGCSQAPHAGVIHEKDYSPAYTTLMPIYTGKRTILVPEYEPARWEFDLYASKSDHGWVDVDETTFDRYQVGDRYSW